MKKMMIAVIALMLGAVAAEARDVVTLGLYIKGDGAAEQLNKLPKGVSLGKPKKTKAGWMAFSYHVNLGVTQSAELQFKIVKGGTGFFSLYAFNFEKGKKRTSIPVKCKVLEINGEPVDGVPRTIKKWSKMATRELKDGDVVTVKVEFEKQEQSDTEK